MKTNKPSSAPLKKMCLFTPSQRRLPYLSAGKPQTLLACAAQMVATQQKAEGLPAQSQCTCLVSGYTETWSVLLLQQGCSASEIPNKYRMPPISFEQHLVEKATACEKGDAQQ